MAGTCELQTTATLPPGKTAPGTQWDPPKASLDMEAKRKNLLAIKHSNLALY